MESQCRIVIGGKHSPIGMELLTIRGNSLLCSFLATGDSYTGLLACFRMSRPTIHEAINDTCQAILDVLGPKVMPPPTQAD